MILRNSHKLILLIIVLAVVLGNLNQLSARPPAQKTVIINEVMANNQTGLTDEDGLHSDWIELYNRTAQTVNLAGWTLSDDPARPNKWTLPAVSLEPQSYLVLYASGKDEGLHTNFKLNAKGETLGLYKPTSRKFIDADIVSLPPQFEDVAYGRAEALDDWRYFDQPTPGTANDMASAWLGQTGEVQFSHQRGFYESPFSLTLSSQIPEADIFYTLNGSDPAGPGGQVYRQPLSISHTSLVRAVALKQGYKPAPAVTHSYLFLADTLGQAANPPGWPATWGVYPKDYQGHDEGAPFLADYEMDPDILNDPRYRDLIKESLQAIPSLSLVTEMDNLDIYANPRQRGPEWERPLSVELIDPAGVEAGFQINAGFRIQGGKGRNEFYPKHSFRLFFTKDYGPPKLTYPLFANSPVTEFDTLILRGGVNGAFAATDRNIATYTRDEFLRRTQLELSGVASHGRYVHLYLNGLYWGLYNLVERPDASFAASYFGGDKNDWHARNHGGVISGPGERTEGVRYNFINAETSESAYDYLESYLDMEQFADYLIANWYAGNNDWARKNWYSVIREPNGKAKYFVWDAENTWFEGANIDFGDPEKNKDFGVKAFLDTLILNSDFKIILADQLYEHLFNNGPLTDENALARWQQLNAEVEQAIIAESARWGDAQEEQPLTQADWYQMRDAVTAQIKGNAQKLIDVARAEGYYPTIDPPAFSRQGGIIEPGTTITLQTHLPSSSLPQGPETIWYTLNHTDPREAGSGAVSAQAQPYTGPIILTTTTEIQARSLINGEWSALNEAAFYVGKPAGELIITEIMYNPPGGNDYEFIKLQNTSNDMLDVSNLRFTGINFTFPAQSALPPNEAIVLVSNADAFSERYPGVPFYGIFGRNLSNRGETITLNRPDGEPLISLTYDDENGWPLSPDGAGDSLKLIDPAGDMNDPANWRASERLYGSPGED